MYFMIRFDWDKMNSTRSFDRIVGCFDTIENAHKAIVNLPYDEFRNAVAIVDFPINKVLCAAIPSSVYIYDENNSRFYQVFEPYIENQYFYM